MNTRGILAAFIFSSVGVWVGAAGFRPTGSPPISTVPLTAPTSWAKPSDPPLPPIAPKDRITLFNGKDLTGWKVTLADKKTDPDAVWKVTDGVLSLNTKINGWVATDSWYKNYKLHVEWRWPKDAVANSNSGVLVFLCGDPPAGAVWPVCFECQLKTGNAGQITGMALDIPGAPMQSNRKRANKFIDSSEKPHGEWNSYDIITREDTLEVFVNDVRQNYVKKLGIIHGAIALQMEGYPLEFRNVWVEPAPQLKDNAAQSNSPK